MIRDHFRVMVVDLGTGRGSVATVPGRDEVGGGSGLAALLFRRYGFPDRPWDDPEQPVIFAIGPLTGYFPLMSKTVCGFKSPYHDQYAESHAGGRSALALRFADLDALVVVGRAPELSCLVVGSRRLGVQDVGFMKGMDVLASGKLLRRMFPGSGHRSILRIGPAGERGAATACINVETYRHFGRLGAGGALGAKNLKAVVILGDGDFPLPEGSAYPELFREVHEQLTATDMMSKYHNIGTPINVTVLNELSALPCRNLQRTREDDIGGIAGERFARDTLLRNRACAGCPVGCIHIGFIREMFQEENQWVYRQVAYDHEPIFATGSMLGVGDAFQVLGILDAVERVGLDVISAGVGLAWATEAAEKGLISEEETIVPLRFGDAGAYREAVEHLGRGTNAFYRLLAEGTLKAAKVYGGGEFACVLGQEMAGYATGETFFVSQALGFRHSHLDSAGYAYDQKDVGKDARRAAHFLVEEERTRVLLTSMVACLFARGVYTEPMLARCLDSVGYGALAARLPDLARDVQRLRWNLRAATGFDPEAVEIPRRFTEIRTWRGPLDGAYLGELRRAYTARIRELMDRADGGAPAGS